MASQTVESDPQTIDGQDQPTWVSEDQGSTHITRSYECTFCKRGFSNAQALGGHMNIHRKDRAKLKHPSNNNHQLGSPSPYEKNNPSQGSMDSKDERNHMVKWPWIVRRDSMSIAAGDGEPHQLSLFVDAPSSHDVGRIIDGVHGAGEDRHIESSEGGSKKSCDLELDLELRLGTEPYGDTVMSSGLKEFPR